jgi:putative ABC transport system permease protein
MTPSVLTSALHSAVQTLTAHKLRTFLTLLSLIAGTGTIITIASIIAGYDSAVSDMYRSFGPTMVIAFKYKLGLSGVSWEDSKRKPLSLEQSKAVAERCQTCSEVSTVLLSNDISDTFVGRYKGSELMGLVVNGVDESYQASGTVLKSGRFISSADNGRRLAVCVLGEDIQKAWFPNLEPVGKLIDVAGHQLEVVGVMERPAATLPGMEDRRILVPYATMRKMRLGTRENMLMIFARDTRSLPEAMDQVRSILRIERRLRASQPDDFALTTAEEIISQYRKNAVLMEVVLVVFGSIGLIVSGVGVMNIMLISVNERTQEIGIRRAVGASRTDILTQCLAEAIILTTSGGLIGVGIGALGAVGVRAVFPAIPAQVPLWAVGVGFAVSLSVGLFFGIWPAEKAASLNPVDAVRHE